MLTEEQQAAQLEEVGRLANAFRSRAVTGRFRYRNVSADIERLMDDVAADMPNNPLGIALIVPIQNCVIDCYYERGAFEPLAAMYSRHKRWTSSYFERFFEQLEQERRFDLIERVCTSIARNARALFFYHRVERDYGVQERVGQVKQEVLQVYDKCIEWTARGGLTEAAERLRMDRDALHDERFPMLPPASDLRKVDETVFWDLIRRSHSPVVNEHVEILGELLKNFRGPDIKRFASLYARHMKQLYHWNVWALAYAARGGCSDDSFEEFRTWLILQGNPELLDLAVREPEVAAQRVPRDPELPDGTLLPIIDEAYLARCGSTIELLRIDLAKPKGKGWSEDAFDATFPELARHYAA